MQNMFDMQQVLIFLNELSRNNNKPWFEEHRAEYDTARGTFERFIDRIIDEFREPDGLNGLSAKECVSRIYRDVRFSKDKSPYHTNLWAHIAPGGKKSMRMGYYLSIQPHEQSVIAGGIWDPTSEKLAKFRQAIDRNAARFKQIVQAKPFVEYFGMVEGEKVKTTPQGFDKSHPEIELLKLKQVIAAHYFPDQEVMGGDFTERVIEGCKAMRPFLDYLEGIE